MILTRISAITVSLLIPLAAAAQQPASQSPGSFALFEDIESRAENSVAATRREAAENRANRPDNPTFSLVGTTRIGNKQSVIVAPDSGDAIVVNLDANGEGSIPDYPGYRVIAAEAGQVSLQIPGSANCTEFPERGVTCNGNTATMRLTVAEAIVERQPVEEPASESEEDLIANPGNPFERIRAAQQVDGSAPVRPNSQRFQPRRIDPADVPPGMRVVSTPFGDRLVEN